MALKEKLAAGRQHFGDRRYDAMQERSRRIEQRVNDCPFLTGVMKSVSFIAGARTIVTHGLGTPAVAMPIRVQGAPFQHGHSLEQGVVERAKSIGTWSNTAANQTNGTRWTLRTNRTILGVRFAWRTSFTSRVVLAKLWDDASGSVLGSVYLSVSSTGIYEARFAKPITQNLVGKNITASVWESAGLEQTTSDDVTWRNLVTVRAGEDIDLVHGALVATGDARPTTNHGAAVSILVEPILAAAPIVGESNDQSGIDTDNQLALECSATASVDLWLYPRAA